MPRTLEFPTGPSRRRQRPVHKGEEGLFPTLCLVDSVPRRGPPFPMHPLRVGWHQYYLRCSAKDRGWVGEAAGCPRGGPAVQDSDDGWAPRAARPEPTRPARRPACPSRAGARLAASEETRGCRSAQHTISTDMRGKVGQRDACGLPPPSVRAGEPAGERGARPLPALRPTEQPLISGRQSPADTDTRPRRPRPPHCSQGSRDLCPNQCQIPGERSLGT